jgi:hypothetical protein
MGLNREHCECDHCKKDIESPGDCVELPLCSAYPATFMHHVHSGNPNGITSNAGTVVRYKRASKLIGNSTNESARYEVEERRRELELGCVSRNNEIDKAVL